MLFIIKFHLNVLHTLGYLIYLTLKKNEKTKAN